MFLPVRKHRHRNYYISPGLSLFLPGQFKINNDSNTIFWKFRAGLSLQRMPLLSLSPRCFSILPFIFLSSRIARWQSTQFFFRWINHMCHHRRSCVCVWSAEEGGRHRKNVERLSVHKDIDVWLRERRKRSGNLSDHEVWLNGERRERWRGEKKKAGR